MRSIGGLLDGLTAPFKLLGVIVVLAFFGTPHKDRSPSEPASKATVPAHVERTP